MHSDNMLYLWELYFCFNFKFIRILNYVYPCYAC